MHFTNAELCASNISLSVFASKSLSNMHTQKTSMSCFLLPLILSFLLIAARATIPEVSQVQAGISSQGGISININTTQPEAAVTPTTPPNISPTPSSQQDSGPTDPDIVKVFLDLHNHARVHANMPPYVWNTTLEQYAKNYAAIRANSDCRLIHSNGTYGENLFWGGGSQWTPKDAVKMWIKEHKFYNPNSNSCKQGRLCGHYTQIVWRDSTQLGCAVGRCKNNDTFIVCSYDPPGNYMGERPYIHYTHDQQI